MREVQTERPAKECRAVFALYSEELPLGNQSGCSWTRSLPSLRANLTPEHRFNVRRNRGDRSSRAWSNGVGRTVLFYREKGKAEYSAGVGWEQEGKRILFDIAGEAVEDTFEVILRMLLPFL